MAAPVGATVRDSRASSPPMRKAMKDITEIRNKIQETTRVAFKAKPADSVTKAADSFTKAATTKSEQQPTIVATPPMSWCRRAAVAVMVTTLVLAVVVVSMFFLGVVPSTLEQLPRAELAAAFAGMQRRVNDARDELAMALAGTQLRLTELREAVILMFVNSPPVSVPAAGCAVAAAALFAALVFAVRKIQAGRRGMKEAKFA